MAVDEEAKRRAKQLLELSAPSDRGGWKKKPDDVSVPKDVEKQRTRHRAPDTATPRTGNSAEAAPAAETALKKTSAADAETKRMAKQLLDLTAGTAVATSAPNRKKPPPTTPVTLPTREVPPAKRC